MAEELNLKVKLETEYNELKETAKKVPLNSEQGERVAKGLEAARKALNAEDWDSFRASINKVGKILTQTLAATGNISEALQRAINLKTSIEKQVNDLKDNISKIKSKYTEDMTRFTNEGAHQHFSEWTGKNGVIRSDSGQTLGREEAIKRFQEALKEASGKITSITNEIAQAAKLQNREAAFAVGRYIKTEDTTRIKDIREINRLTTEQEGYEGDIARLDEEIARLTPASTEAAEALEKLYKQIVDIVSAANTNVTSKKAEERRAASDASGTALNADDLNTATKALDKQSSSLGRAFKQFTLYAIALRTVKKALHEAANTIKNLDKYLTEQAMVTGKTRKETYALLGQYQQMAAALGATTKEVAEVATQFMRQGKSTNDALTLTTAAISAAKVAGISAAESVNYLTTALNGFQLSAQKAMEVSDKFAAIAAQSATSYEEIATALSKVAAQANLAGMSIDYTTALLAKGIETTREAPETIGTALKTIIARMRELTDYGTTLEDGMDINNVETQLAYVGITLRDTNGELRSTEDVLDDLGNAWDTLSSNQQAAVAKALAGTRQQSRLIAMMNDYERVTELQQIAQRSAGATAAQAAVYLEGMEAALNKVSVAWEKIVTSITDNEGVINFIEYISNALDTIGEFLSNDWGLTATLTIALGLAVSTLSTKIQEFTISKAQQQIENMLLKTKLLKRAAELKSLIAIKQQLIQEKAKTIEEKKSLAFETIKQQLANKEITAAQATALMAQAETDAMKDEATLQAEIAELTSEQLSVNVQLDQLGASQVSNWTTIASTVALTSGGLLSVLTESKTWLFILGGVALALKTIPPIIKTIIALNKMRQAQETNLSLIQMAGAATGLGVPGLIIAAALMLAAGVAAASVAISAAVKSNASSTADDINKLSNEIYKLNEKANAIKTIEDQFEALDKKIVKTAEDQEKLNELLDSAGDKLSAENKKDSKGKDIAGTSEQDIYNALETEQDKYNYLQQAEKNARQRVEDLRRQQLNILESLNEASRKELLTNQTNTEYLKVQSAVRATVNQQLYDTVDLLKDAKEGTEEFTQAILNQMSASELYQYAIENDAKSIKKLVDTVNKATTWKSGQEFHLVDILGSDNYSFKERIEAFNILEQKINAIGDSAIMKNFREAYQQWYDLRNTMSETSLDFMYDIGMTIERLNDWGIALQKFGMDAQEATERINSVIEAVQSGISIGNAIRDIFQEELSQFDEGTEEWLAAYRKLLNAYQSATGVSILNIGQSMEALHNRVNNIYEMAQKWNELSDTEKTTFMNDNADLFSGEEGKRLYEAFKTQNYNLIQQELENNQILKDTIEKRKQELQILLDIEEARDDDQRNEGQIAYLKEQIKLLNETKDIYRASLKVRLEQEQAQLNIYKEFLNKQQKALEDSLNKRKDAYSKYFEAINQEAENQEYDDKANQLISNLSKLAASDDANSKMQSAELEAQLKELEQERLAELRERAQEAVLENIDDQLSQISDKFDKLLENNQLLLQAMTAQITGDPTGFISSVLASGTQNLTALGAESYLEEFRATFGSILPSSALDNISITESTSGDTLILNVTGTEIEIGDSTQQELYLAIMKAMRQLGIK